MPFRKYLVVAALVALQGAPASCDDETDRALAAIQAVAREGKGNDDAGPAWKTLVGKGAPALFPALQAIDDANPTAANWLRAAVEAIAESEKAAGRQLPARGLQAFAATPHYSAGGRLLAYELLISVDPAAKERLLPSFVDDRSPELRRSAIEFELEKLEKGGKAASRDELLRLFRFTRDKDQVELLAKKLAVLGAGVSISEHMGFVTHFSLVGPFDSTGGKGFHTVYPPESARDISGKFTGKADAALTWKPVDTADSFGLVDLNKALDKHKEAVAYALAVVAADHETLCEIRIAAPNAIQLFLNGKKVFEREEYHHGSPLDANIGKGVLKKGNNVIVLKVCQNNQTEAWAQSWEFKLRVCDATGGQLAGVTQHLLESGKNMTLGYIPESARAVEEKK